MSAYENPYDSDPENRCFEYLHDWTKESLIVELIDKMTEDEKIEFIRD